MKNPIYTLYGMVMLGVASVAQWSGLSAGNINEVKNVPKSVRDNPGVYRSHYAYLPRWFGGK